MAIHENKAFTWPFVKHLSCVLHLLKPAQCTLLHHPGGGEHTHSGSQPACWVQLLLLAVPHCTHTRPLLVLMLYAPTHVLCCSIQVRDGALYTAAHYWAVLTLTLSPMVVTSNCYYQFMYKHTLSC